MSRLEGGPGTPSSTLRSLRLAFSSPGANSVPPAPAAVSVERLVGIGLVGPPTVRPASGVWDKVRSSPSPPRRGERLVADVDRTERFGAAFLGLEGLFAVAVFFLVRLPAAG